MADKQIKDLTAETPTGASKFAFDNAANLSRSVTLAEVEDLIPTAANGVTLRSASGVTQYTGATAVADALAAAVSGDSVIVSGSHAESVSVPAGVALLGGASGEITGALATGARITLASGAKVSNLGVTLPTDATAAILHAGAGSVDLHNIALTGVAGVGIGVHNSGTGDTVVHGLQHNGDAQSVLVCSTGRLVCRDLTVMSGTITEAVVAETAGEIALLGALSETSGVGDFLRVEGGGTAEVTSAFVEDANNAIHVLGAASVVRGLGIHVDGSGSWDLLVETAAATAEVHLQGEMRTDKISAPSDMADLLLTAQSDTPGDYAALLAYGEVSVGRPGLGSELVVGEGDSYTVGMMVLTTDATAGPTSDGAGFVDVSTAAASATASTFSFQGVAAGHSILIASTLENTADRLKHWGIKVAQTIAATEAVAKSFALEVWDGAAWVEFSVMATNSSTFARYANTVFQRGSTSEHIRFGLTPETTWAKKTINGQEAYWTRIRVTNTLTVAPVFQQFKLSTARTEINGDGTITSHGPARYEALTLPYGRMGDSGLGNVSVTVGGGGSPTQWTHEIRDQTFGSANDELNFQGSLPRGIDTSLPLWLDVVIVAINTGPNETIAGALLPVGVKGVPIADPAFGLVPVPRATPEKLTYDAGQAYTESVPFTATEEDAPQLISFGPFDVSNHYEGDVFFAQVLQQTNNGGAIFTSVSVSLRVGMWTPGGHQ